jgi:hypothetical protein
MNENVKITLGEFREKTNKIKEILSFISLEKAKVLGDKKTEVFLQHKRWFEAPPVQFLINLNQDMNGLPDSFEIPNFSKLFWMQLSSTYSILTELYEDIKKRGLE